MSSDAGKEFLQGIGKRLWYLLPALLLDPFDLYNKYLRHWFAGDGREVDMPAEYFPWVLGALLLWVSFLTYRELYMTQKKGDIILQPPTFLTVRLVSHKWTAESVHAIVGISGTGAVVNSVRLEGEGSGAFAASPVPPMYESNWEAKAVAGYHEFPVVFSIDRRFLGRCRVVLDVGGMEFKSKLEILRK